MALTINTNIPSLTAQRALNFTQNKMSASLSRLSTGLRINQAADDAAGLAISETLKAQIRSLAQAERNANDGVSMLQVAEGAMNEMSGILTRMRELATQAATGTYGSTERGFLNDEFQQLIDELDRISEVTEFNGTRLIDGSLSVLSFQVGINATSNDVLSVGIGDLHTTALGGTSAGDSIQTQDITTMENARASLAVIDQAIMDISAQRGALGALQNRLNVTILNLSSARENLSAANSRIRDVDMATETTELTKSQILMQAGVSVLAQANQMPTMALSLLQ